MFDVWEFDDRGAQRRESRESDVECRLSAVAPDIRSSIVPNSRLVLAVGKALDLA